MEYFMVGWSLLQDVWFSPSDCYINLVLEANYYYEKPQ